MELLSDKRLIIVSGKGGVGKSTVAAAVALRQARSGKRTLVCEVNAPERITGLLDKPPVGPEMAEIEPNLWAVNVHPTNALREYALMTLKFNALYNAVFENRLVRYFLRFIPSIQELVMLGKILHHVREKKKDGSWKYDCVVMDAPATGHAITFLKVPQVLLDTVPAGPLSNDVLWMRDILVDPATTTALLVSLAEEMPVNETLELYSNLKDQVRIETSAILLNMTAQMRFSDKDLQELEQQPALLHWARSQHQRARLTLEADETLRKRSGLPVFHVPRLYGATHGISAVEQVSQRLSPLWGAPA